MKFYTIAEVTNETIGHGDSLTQSKVTRLGGWGAGEFPPLFESEKEASLWAEGQKFYNKIEVVNMSTHEKDKVS